MQTPPPPFLPKYTEVPGGVSPADILAFVTGCPVIPPMGYPRKLRILFIGDKSKTLPTANTCGPNLLLPLALKDYPEFKERLDYAFSNTIGFGQV
jgi:hypothetical protein